jgi:hypothetical protein
MGVAATVPAGTLQIPWSIEGAAVSVDLPANPVAISSGASVAFVPSVLTIPDSPSLLGPFTAQQAAQAALQYGYGSGGNLSMAQHIQGYVVTPPPGVSYWVLCEWPSGPTAPSFGTIVTVRASS